MTADRRVEQRSAEHSAFETTGICLPKGEELTLIVNGNADNLSVWIGQQGKYSKLDKDEGSREFVEISLTEGENTISREDSDGVVYLVNTSYTEAVEVEMIGGKNVPYSVLGETTDEEFEQQVADFSGECNINCVSN